MLYLFVFTQSGRKTADALLLDLLKHCSLRRVLTANVASAINDVDASGFRLSAGVTDRRYRFSPLFRA